MDHEHGPAPTARSTGLPGAIGWLYAGGVLLSGWLLFDRFRPAFLPVPRTGIDPGWLAWSLCGLGLGWWLWGRRAAAPRAPLADAVPRLPAQLNLRVEAPPPPSTIWNRYGQGMLDPLAIEPADLCAEPPGLGWQACIDRLAALRGPWQAARGERELRTRRLLWLDAALLLLDRGVVRPLHDGALPDVASLRTERLLLGADAGPAVLAEVPALFARRIACALDSLPPQQRVAAEVHVQRLRALQPLLARERALERHSQVILALAWNPEVDLDQVEVAYALADEYRAETRDWLLQAAALTMPNGSTSLANFLLSRCERLADDGGDAIGYVEALRPMHVGMRQLMHDAVSVLVTLADGVERSRGVVPLAALEGGAQRSTT